MNAFRNIYTVKNNRIIIELPEALNQSSVEVIVLPINEDDKSKRIEQLLTVSTWDEGDIKPIIESQKLFNKWDIKEF